LPASIEVGSAVSGIAGLSGNLRCKENIMAAWRILGILSIFACTGAGCVSPWEIREKLVMSEWPLVVQKGALEVFVQERLPNETKTFHQVFKGDSHEFDLVFDTFFREMEDGFPTARARWVDLPKGKWKKLDRHILVQVWPAAEYRAETKMGRFKLYLYIRCCFYKIEGSVVTAMKGVDEDLSLVFGQSFEAGKKIPTYEEISSVCPVTVLTQALEDDTREETRTLIAQIEAAKE
jgi:hypothetical protein